jgi:hypothetical protein
MRAADLSTIERRDQEVIARLRCRTAAFPCVRCERHAGNGIRAGSLNDHRKKVGPPKFALIVGDWAARRSGQAERTPANA